MKQVIAFVSFIVISHSLLKAQVYLKPTVGLNSIDFSKDPASGHYTSRIGYQGGLSLLIGRTVFIEPGAFYLRESNYITDTTSRNKVKYDTSGFRFPLAIGVELWDKDRHTIGFRFFGGPSLFFPANVKNKTRNDYKTSLFAGVGIDISFFFIEAQYDWLVTNVQKDLSEINVGEKRSLFINLGVRIRL